MKKILLLTFLTNLFSQLPIELERNQISDSIDIEVIGNSEFLLEITAFSNTDWSESNSESATITIGIDGEWGNYNQDVILFNGSTPFNYSVSLGHLSEGSHYLQFKFDYDKSSINADYIYIESINLIDIQDTGIDIDAFLHSPILYGRDLLSWNESTYTDIPLIMWHEIFYDDGNKVIRYSLIFSNEDSRIGIGLSDLMFSYGRTTDIEWLYEVTLDSVGEIINEKYQGPNHIDTEFNGDKYYKHPILKNATLNCNFTDDGISSYKFFLSPKLTLNPGFSRESLMDINPWSYAVMAKELEREGSYEEIANPESVEISDVRNYLYIEYNGDYVGNDTEYQLDIIVKLFGSCDKFYHDHHFNQFEFNYTGGLKRTSIELNDDFNPADIESIIFSSENSILGQININNILKIFYLDNEYSPIEMDFEFEPFSINDNQQEFIVEINENINQIDCFGNIQGDAVCDDCNVCDGGNLDLDDCGVCFGENLDLDCNGICFGNAILDECGICNGDNTTCSGCTDINAENYDDQAVFYDGNCLYDDQIFKVPAEYLNIQNAIFYASNGDTVLVSEGVYNENIDFLGKSILVKSLYEEIGLISDYVISGVDSVSTITISNQNGFTGLYGFTITNGYGKGVSFEDFVSLAANPEDLDSLLNNVMSGGGISIIESNPHIKDVYISNNASRNVGAGIAMVNSDAIIESAIISDNIIYDGDALGGGGIAINGGNPTLDNVEIINNYVGGNMYYLNGGGGILCGFSLGENQLSLDIKNSKIYNNNANIGAGIGALSGNINIYKSVISSNTGDYGSAISMGEPLGLIVGDINMNLSNSTVVNNSGSITVGLINSAYLNINNSIFWSNNGDYEIINLPNNNELNILSSFSLFETEILGLNNLFGYNPLFVNDSILDYRLQANSPCIDAGTSFVELDGEVILEINESEYYGLAPDMGAYEYNPLSIDKPVEILPIKYSLEYPYPNPFNPTTSISFSLPNQSQTSIKVYDIKGNLISTLLDESMNVGYHQIEWNADGYPSGVYFVKLDAGEFTQTQKLMLVK